MRRVGNPTETNQTIEAVDADVHRDFADILDPHMRAGFEQNGKKDWNHPAD